MVGGVLTLQDDYIDNNSADFILEEGTFDANDHNVSIRSFYCIANKNRILYMGNGIWTLSYQLGAATKWRIENTGTFTLYPENSTIILTNSTANAQTFAGGGLTYNNVQVAGSGAYALTVTGNNTFNNFTMDASLAIKTIKFTDGTTTHVTNLLRDTNGTNIITLTGTGTAGWTITKDGGGIVNLDYLDISYSTAN
jgi:hypothetical protein